jgi:xanthine dehydrogenase YagS FAD-binding subunit
MLTCRADFFILPVTLLFISAPCRFYPFISFRTPPAEGVRGSCRKVRARRTRDFALAGFALAVVFSKGQAVDCRMVLSGAAKKRLNEKGLNQERAAGAAAAAVKDAQPMAHNEYKIPLFRGRFEQQLMAIARR